MPVLTRMTRYTTRTDIATVLGTSASALALLSGETDGLAIDATTAGGSLAIKDTTTPANNKNDVLLNAGNLVQSGTSAKVVAWNDNTVHTYAAGQIAQEFDGTRFGILIEPTATNLALQSDDFTSGSWTKTSMTTAKTATGPDTLANSATTLTASAGNATALQAITSASSTRVTSAWIKRRTGTGNIDLTQDNGGTWTTQAVTSAWQRFSLAAVTSTDPTVGIRIVTSGDAVDVWGYQHEIGAIVTSTIPTTTIPGLRNPDSITCATSTYPHSDATGTFIAWVKVRQLDNPIGVGPVVVQTSDGTGNERVIFFDRTAGSPDQLTLIINDGGVNQATIIGTSVSLSGNKGAAAYQLNNAQIVTDGTASAVDTGCTMPTCTQMDLGRSPSTAGLEFNGYIYQLTYVPRRMTAVEMQTRTA